MGGTRLIKREQPLHAIEILNKAKPQIRPKIVEELKKLSYQFFHEFTPGGLISKFRPQAWKLAKVFSGVFLGRPLNLNREIRLVEEFSRHNYPMVLCSVTPLSSLW